MSVRWRQSKNGRTLQVDVSYRDPVTGEVVRFRRALPGVKTKSEGRQIERMIRNRLFQRSAAQRQVKAVITFEAFTMRHWAPKRRVDWSHTTWRAYEQALRFHLVPYFGEMALIDIGPEMIQKYKSDKRHPADGIRALAPKTINNHLGIVSVAFTDAIKWGYATTNPRSSVADCQSDDVLNDDVDAFWSEEEIVRFLVTVRQHRPQWYAFFLTALHTGMRLGELAGLLWEDVDLDRGVVTVRRSLSHGVEKRPKKGRKEKGHKIRRIPISEPLSDALHRHRQRGEGHRVFLSNDGRDLDHNRVRSTFRTCIRRAGVRRIRFHDLRHTFASTLTGKDTALQKVGTLLGHASHKSTARYSHVDLCGLRDAVGRLPAPKVDETGGGGAGA